MFNNELITRTKMFVKPHAKYIIGSHCFVTLHIYVNVHFQFLTDILASLKS